VVWFVITTELAVRVHWKVTTNQMALLSMDDTCVEGIDCEHEEGCGEKHSPDGTANVCALPLVICITTKVPGSGSSSCLSM